MSVAPDRPGVGPVVARLRTTPSTRRRLLGRAAVGLVVARLLVAARATGGAERLLSAVDAVPARLPGRPRPSPADVDWAVRTAARHLPGAYTCLPRALVARTLLARGDHGARLRIGVRVDDDRAASGFAAHAWVTDADGAVVVGDLPDIDAYRPLPLSSVAALGRGGPRGGCKR